MTTITPQAQEALIHHYKQGVGDNCLVCDRQLLGSWTDYNGQIRCWMCGTTYQILGSHLREEWMKEVGLKKEEVARRYCDCFELISLLRNYWTETHREIPFGMYLGRSPIPKEAYQCFYGWLKKNAAKYEQEYPDDFSWDSLKADTSI